MSNVKNSYSLYLEIRRKSGLMDKNVKCAKAEELIDCIYNELVGQWPYKAEYAAFIREVKAMLAKYSEQPLRITEDRQQGYLTSEEISLISMADAYIIMTELCEYVKSKNDINKRYRFRFYDFLFNGYPAHKIQLTDIDRVLKCIQTLDDILKDMRKPEMDVINDFSHNQMNSGGWNILVHEKALTKKAEPRRQKKQTCMQTWHEEQSRIKAEIARIQPLSGELLESFISSSKSIIEDYVLWFAEELIEVFNLISDGYAYHKKIAEASENADYWEAVLNYEGFCLSIIDGLALFGVEEISTPPGERFDRQIHCVEDDAQASLAARAALVAESVRAGFRYKDVVIQKEKVKVRSES